MPFIRKLDYMLPIQLRLLFSQTWGRPSILTIQIEAILLNSTFQWCCLLCSSKWFLLYFDSLVEVLKCDHSNECYWAVLFSGAVYYAIQRGSKYWFCGWSPRLWPFKSSVSCWTVLSCSTVYHAIQRGCNYWFCAGVKS